MCYHYTKLATGIEYEKDLYIHVQEGGVI